MTTHQEIVDALTAIIEREESNGCPMAHPMLVEPAIRRWKSYARRSKNAKHVDWEHRVHDLEKGLLALFPGHNYDAACVRHLAESFAERLRECLL
ncbi:hypothetical protein [Blastopirellula marina]|uniref:Uncharacterized protein n=1 Tax=Blastopirellula marina TaxID=124 RepID=A0A2S8F8B3_9BACT|nr:hypothetical protein [Blastopirellula marina]PQO28174.1 hypothetical protein C5Y98_25050 [Blastopirellula marina]PTL41714.1 hypothetical protein C5Y97_25065 [Blastopirellula marina]